MRLQLLSEPASWVVLILAISAIFVNAEIIPEYDESTSLNEEPRDFYNDLTDCYECQHGAQYKDTIMRYGCIMSKNDPVSILFAFLFKPQL